MKKTKVLWFSRHQMSADQLSALELALGNVELTQVSGSPANVHVTFEGLTPEGGQQGLFLTGTLKPLKELVAEYDEVAVVLPIGMLQQLLPFAPSKRLLQAKSLRVLEEGGKVSFVFGGWEQVLKVEVVTQPL